jgi:hypothetical protein
MTAFTKDMLPPEVDTVEKVSAWAATVLASTYPQKTSYESKENEVRSVSIIPFFNDTNETRNLWGWQVILRVSIPLASDYLEGEPLYKKALPLGSLAIPQAFLAPEFVSAGGV